MSWAIIAIKVIDLAALALVKYPELQARFDGARAVSEKAKAEGRDPTPEEWASLDTETDRLIASIEGS